MRSLLLTNVVVAFCCATSAAAQVPRGFIDVQGAGLARAATEVMGPLEVTAGGQSLGGRLSAEWYTAPTGLGFLVAMAGERTVVSGQDFTGVAFQQPTVDLRARAGLAGRLTVGRLVVDGALGYAGAKGTLFVAPGGALAMSELWSHGPFGSANVGVEFGFLSGRLGGFAQPVQWAAGSGASWSGGSYALSAEVAAGGWSVGEVVRLSAVARYEYAISSVGAPATAVTDQRHTFGLGLRVGLLERPASSAPLLGRLFGKVRRSDGTPAVGAKVQVSGGPMLAVDAGGRFTVEGLAAGPVTVAASEGPRRAEVSAVVRGGETVEVVLPLPAPSGPGKLKGTVAVALSGAAEGRRPLGGAKVSLADGRSAVTDEGGAFVLESVGPGPVPVTVTLAGYRPGSEAVMVPAEGEATAELLVVAEKVVSPAVIRGTVRERGTKSGQVRVSLKDSSLKVALAPDGRFKVSVPPGSYEILFEAPEHVTQTKRVSVRETEQVIFNIDLYPAR